jgi:hypothetical protein
MNELKEAKEVQEVKEVKEKKLRPCCGGVSHCSCPSLTSFISLTSFASSGDLSCQS